MTAVARLDDFRADISLLSSGPVSVPVDFILVHCHSYPVTPAQPDSNAPAFEYGAVRTHDSAIGGWRGIHTADGVFDWSKADTLINTMHGLGKRITFTVFGTPTWAAKPADQGFAGPYGGLGECGVPANLSKLAAFVVALVARYNTSGVRKITYIEGWNEPNFDQNRTGFFWGSAPELVEMCRVIANAARSVDPGITVLAPGFTGDLSSMGKFMQAKAATGESGADISDWIATHPYKIKALASDVASKKSAALASLTAQGQAPKGLAFNEVGVDDTPGGADITAFLALTAAARRLYMLRMLGICAAMGIKHVGLYSYNSGLCGDLVADTTGAMAGITEAKRALSGKIITAASQNLFSQVFNATFSDGSQISW